MTNLSAFSIRHPRFIALALATVIVWGCVALWLLPRQEEPLITWRLANVITRLPGATSERMEALVTDVLERRVSEVDEVEHVYSVSRAGVSLLQIELSDDVTDASPVWQRVRQKLEQAKVELPAGVLGPDLDDEIMGTFAQLIAITSDTASYRDLEDLGERLEDQLRYLPMAASTSFFGLQAEVVRVEIDPTRLAAYDLTMMQVAAAIRGRNTRQPSGRIAVDTDELLLEVSGEFQTLDELRGTILQVTADGQTLHVSDVATVLRTTEEPPAPLFRLNGKRGVVVGVRARDRVRIDRFGDDVHRVVQSFRDTLPPEVECTIFHDLSGYTRERAAELLRTFVFCVVSVFLATALFMGWRGSLIVTSAIPLTGLAVLALFYALGIPLNQMSLMAVVMAFGLLVDDAVVVTEQVHRRVGEQVPVDDAAAKEPATLTAPLIVSTLTTITAFVPIYLLPGGTGEFVRAIPVGVTICLLMALVMAVTAVPWLCTLLLRGQQSAGETGGLRGMRYTCSARFHRLLETVVDQPKATIVVVGVVMLALASLGLTLRRDFFSPVQRDQIVVDVFTAQGSSVEHTSDIVAEIEKLTGQQAHVASTASFVGRNAPLIFYNLQSQETFANHFAQIIVRVDHWQYTTQATGELQAKLNGQIADAHCVAHILEHGAPFVAPFEVRISGPAITTLEELGRRVSRRLEETEGVRNVRMNYGRPSLKLIAQVNEPAARHLGLDQQTVADQLRYRIDGLPASFLREGDEQIGIHVRLPAEDRNDVLDLNSIYFQPPQPLPPLPFAAVATWKASWEPGSIYRRDGQRTLSVLGYPQFGLTAAQVSTRFDMQLQQLARQLPAGYALELGGENEQRQQAESNLMGRAIYAVFPVLLLLLAEFRSLRLALLILAVVPLSLAGVMLGLFVTGWPLNFMAIMGMIMLIGVVVNDALILVDGFERRRELGQTVSEAAVHGTLERSRHVVITTVTTIAGFFPLAVSPSLLWPPLAIAIIVGLACATTITLVAVPAAYVVLRKTSS